MAVPPVTIRNRDSLDANPLMTIINNLFARIPWVNADLASGYAATKLDMAGFTLPTSALPPLGQFAAGNANNRLDSDPAHVLAHGLPWVRRHVTTSWSAVNGSAWVAPLRNGFLAFSQTDERVYETPRNSTGQKDDLLVSQFIHAFTAGDDPVHGVAVSDQVAYISCRGSRILKKISLNSAAAPVTVLNLSGTYSALGKIFVNRFGNYLYLVAKVSCDAYYRRLVRVDISAATATSSELSCVDDFDIVDVVVQGSASSASTGLGQVLIAQKDSTAAGGTVFRARESTTGVFGGAFPTAPEGTVKSYAGTEFIRAMVPWLGRVAVLTQDGTTISCHFLSYDEPGTPGAAEIFDATIAGSTPVLIDGGACTDGLHVYAQRDDGRIAVFHPYSATGVAWVPRTGITGAAGTYQSPGGLCWTGKSVAGVFRVTATGNGEYSLV